MNYMDMLNNEATALLEHREIDYFDEIGFSQLLESVSGNDTEKRAEELVKQCKTAVDEARKEPDVMRIKRVIGTAVSGVLFAAPFIAIASTMGNIANIDETTIPQNSIGKMMLSLAASIGGMGGLIASNSNNNYEMQKYKELISFIDTKLKEVDGAISSVKDKGGKTADLEKVRKELADLREKYNKIYHRHTISANVNINRTYNY